MTKLFTILWLIGLIFSLQPLSAQTLLESKLTAGDGDSGDAFGTAVAISGNRLIIGAPFDEPHGSKSGSAYLFVNNGSGWVQEAKLTASDGASEDWFGFSVDMDSTYAIVGAPHNFVLGGQGKAYIFKRQGNSWVEEAILLPSDTTAGTQFGSAVAISGEYALIGAYREDGAEPLTGAAYIFRRNDSTWSQQIRLLTSDGGFGDRFGNAVSLDGDDAIIGAMFDNDNGGDAGAAYIFHNTGFTWIEQTKLLASDGTDMDAFGISVAINGDFAIVGADMSINGGNGAAYVFQRDTTAWNEIVKLTASDGASEDQFGYSVDISDGMALVGSIMTLSNGNGAAYLFRGSGSNWHESMKITASDGAANEAFGAAVAMQDSSVFLVGSPGDNDNGNASGSAYVYENPAVGITGQPAANLPQQFVLLQNFPNPFNPETAISYQLSDLSHVRLEIYNSVGQKVKTLVNEQLVAGTYTVQWNGTNDAGQQVASGVYLNRLRVGNTFVQTRKMMLMK